MKVQINGHVYEMPRNKFKELLKIAKDSIKHGIIAIEKNGLAEMRKDTFSSNIKFKQKVDEFKKLGYKVYKS